MFKGKAHFRLIEASWKQLCFLLCQDLSGRGGFCSKDLLTFSTKTFQKKRERERENPFPTWFTKIKTRKSRSFRRCFSVLATKVWKKVPKRKQNVTKCKGTSQEFFFGRRIVRTMSFVGKRQNQICRPQKHPFPKAAKCRSL